MYDCAVKSKGVSLNEKLMKGPNLVNRLVGVLLRFRKERIAIVSDIEGMFHQVRCAPEDRDCLRFLWWPQGDLSKECAAFALLETAKQFGKNYGVVVVEIVKKSFYVDDCLITVADENKGIRLVKDLQNLLACGRFRLNKWIFTSPAVIQSINVEDRAQVLSKIELGDVASERVLGMRWNVQSDDFQFVTNLPNKPPTRRNLLSITNAVFDPLGFLSSVVLEARLLFRKLCHGKIKWDESVSPIDAVHWERWKESLCSMKDLVVPRCVKPMSDVCDVQLHTFADASNVARGAVCYLRYVDRNEQVHCSLVMAKSLLAGSEKHTIPRLELEAALDAVRLAKFVCTELELHSCPCIY